MHQLKGAYRWLLIGILLGQFAACRKPRQNTIVYVAARDGLIVRDQPALDGKRLKTIPFGIAVLVHEEKSDTISIDKTDGKWTLVECATTTIRISCNGWVFGGFLSDTQTPEMRDINDKREMSTRVAVGPVCHARCDNDLQREKADCQKELLECQRTSGYYAGHHLTCPVEADDKAADCHRYCD